VFRQDCINLGAAELQLPFDHVPREPPPPPPRVHGQPGGLKQSASIVGVDEWTVGYRACGSFPCLATHPREVRPNLTPEGLVPGVLGLALLGAFLALLGVHSPRVVEYLLQFVTHDRSDRCEVGTGEGHSQAVSRHRLTRGQLVDLVLDLGRHGDHGANSPTSVARPTGYSTSAAAALTGASSPTSLGRHRGNRHRQ
jgi:hypothetical protein